MNVHEKLMQVQQKLKAPKSQYNKFGNFYYRSCEDIQEAVKPILSEVKAVLTVDDELILIGSRYYLKATARFTDAEDGTSICNTAYAREAEKKSGMDDAQITGSCSSYARKYALNGLFCIDDAKDPDYPQGQTEKPSGRQQTRQQSKPAVSKEELDLLIREAERTGTDLSKVCKRYLVNSIKELTKEQYQRAMSAFRKMETVPPPAPDGQYEMDLSGMETPFR